MKRFKTLKLMLGVAGLSMLVSEPLHACTRALFTGSDNVVITGRSMDWNEYMGSEIWVLPRGIERTGEAGTGSAQWKAKYGSVITAGYNVGSADGMNEKGLVMNLLYLAESDYGTASPARPRLSISLWGQYALDNFATVAEAVAAMKTRPFQIVAPTLPNGAASSLHLSLSDSTGDSAIFQYVKGELIIYHDKKYKVMTNSPLYDEQLALDAYWKKIGGSVFLPGTNRAADRFARTSFYIGAIPQAVDKNLIQSVPSQTYDNQAVASVLSVIRSVSVPLGITTPNEPNIASTLWRTIADQKNLVYYFDSSTRPNTFWVDLRKLNFAEGAPVLKLDMAKGQVYSGEISSFLKPAIPFKFLPAM
ncbi:MAG: linear amide C-N hydrolase [Alphaproteobacteria bacterium]